jgi:hypothetical protein
METMFIMMEEWEGREIMDKFDREMMLLNKYEMKNLSRYPSYQL